MHATAVSGFDWNVLASVHDVALGALGADLGP
jgi:hypothetical protein